MATSGSFSTTNGYTTSGGYKFNLKFSWERTSYSIENNTSTIKWTISGDSTSSGGYVKAQNMLLKIDGATVWTHKVDVEGQVNMYNGTVIATGTHTFKHNSDGTKSFTVYIEGGLYYWSPPNATGTKSFTLNTIPRASSISATNVNIGSQTTISVSKATSSFTHTITYVFGNLSGTIATKSSSATIKWTVPTTFYGQIPSSKTGVCTLTCETFNGSTSLGKKNAKFTVTAAQSLCKPLLAPTAVDTNETTIALTGDNNTIIRYYSNVQTQVNATVRNSAILKSISTKHNNTTTTTDISNFNAVSTNTFDFSATDSRGYTGTATKTLTMINYIRLTCNFEPEMPTTDGVMNFKVSGNCFNGSFGAKDNTLTLVYRFKEDGGEWGEWAALNATLNGNTYSVESTITGLDYQKTYVFVAKVSDALEEKSSTEVKVNTLPVFDWGEEDFNFNVPVAMNGNIILKDNISSGNTVLAANGGAIYFRPNGDTSTSGEARLTSSGNLIVGGYTVPKFLTGTASIKRTKKNTTTVSVTFSKAFTTAPTIFVQQVFNDCHIFVAPTDVSTTGFKASLLAADDSASTTLTFGWMAVGT